MRSTTTFALRATAVISVIVAAGFDVPWVGTVPMLVVVLYSALAIREARTAPGLLETRAEEVYFLGYLSTLAAFGGILLMLVRGGQLPDNLITLLPMVVIALMGTVAGLFGMATLKDVSANRKRKSGASLTPWEDSVLQALNRLVELIAVSPAGADPLVTVAENRALTDASTKTSRIIQDLNGELDGLRGCFVALTTQVNLNVASAKAYETSVKEVEQTLKKFVSLVTTLLGEFRGATEKLG